jgi:N-acetylmuramoyl-L-alanine amidase
VIKPTVLILLTTLALSPSSGGRTGALTGMTIAIDPGHNGRNAANAARINRLVDAGTLRKACDTVGASSPSGYSEAEHNLDVALRLERLLRAAGARVVLTRRTNSGWGPCITARAAIGNRARADAAVSIHADGGPAARRGFHVIYPPSIRGFTDDIASASYRLAVAVRRRYRSTTGMPYSDYAGGAGLSRRRDLGGLNLSNVPKVFLEAGNLRNPTDARLLQSARFRQREAQALARALADFLSG